MRIYADESGTHDSKWFVIGMLFVPDHGTLHSKLLRDKKTLGYLNHGKRRKAKFKETHFAAFRTRRDEELAKAWIDRFLASASVFRSVVVEWSQFQGRYFGGPFDPDALKKRRAYKKWAEMLLQPELAQVHNAIFILDRLVALRGYDVIDHLEDRFCLNHQGERRANPRIREFQTARSWKDANQCLGRSSRRVCLPVARPEHQSGEARGEGLSVRALEATRGETRAIPWILETVWRCRSEASP